MTEPVGEWACKKVCAFFVCLGTHANLKSQQWVYNGWYSNFLNGISMSLHIVHCVWWSTASVWWECEFVVKPNTHTHTQTCACTQSFLSLIHQWPYHVRLKFVKKLEWAAKAAKNDMNEQQQQWQIDLLAWECHSLSHVLAQSPSRLQHNTDWVEAFFLSSHQQHYHDDVHHTHIKSSSSCSCCCKKNTILNTCVVIEENGIRSTTMIAFKTRFVLWQASKNKFQWIAPYAKKSTQWVKELDTTGTKKMRICWKCSIVTIWKKTRIMSEDIS